MKNSLAVFAVCVIYAVSAQGNDPPQANQVNQPQAPVPNVQAPTGPEGTPAGEQAKQPAAVEEAAPIPAPPTGEFCSLISVLFVCLNVSAL